MILVDLASDPAVRSVELVKAVRHDAAGLSASHGRIWLLSKFNRLDNIVSLLLR